MKHGFIKTCAVSPKIRVADVFGNLAECKRLATLAAERGAKIIVFPELTLTGATAGDLFLTKKLLSAAEEALCELALLTAELDAVIFVGLPVSLSGRVYNAVAALSRGDILAIIPKNILTSAEARYFSSAEETLEVIYAGQETLFGGDILLSADTLDELTVAVSVGSEIFSPISSMRYAAIEGATVIVNPSSTSLIVGRRARTGELLRSESAITLSAIVRAEAGIGESGTDACYAGASEIAQLGRTLASAEPFSEELLFADIDVEYITRERMINGAKDSSAYEFEIIDFNLDITETKLERAPRALVFIPEDEAALDERCKTILDIQSHSLAERILRSHSKGAVVGVSGGLDSTLALLVAVRAADIIGMDRKSIVAVTMPCFGTTKRTKGNAERLAESLGVTLREIDIKAAVSQHFADIGHSPENYSVVYENAQARERTQVLMDIANAEGALVVGTGDLSELALGWATYNGDHMSMYGVNSGVPKTLMRYIVDYCAKVEESKGNTAVSEVLSDVLKTPVSPELLPPKDGEIAQCTEGIVGPYELHDFFIYYHVRRGYSPEKILRLASLAFLGEYDEETILGWLRVFLRRFFSQQFKRSCLPDGAKVGSVGFSPRGDFVMPSDASGELWNI